VTLVFAALPDMQLQEKELALNWDNMSKRSDMSIRGLLFHWVININISLSLLV